MLTVRENEIVRLLASGCTNKDIAPNLRPGHYVFSIRGQDGQGVTIGEGEAAAISLP